MVFQGRAALPSARQIGRGPDGARSFERLSPWPGAGRACDRHGPERLAEIGLHPYSLPLGVDIERWLAKGKTPWDAHPNSSDGKMDAETAALAAALKFPNVRLQTGSRVTRLVTGPDGKAIETVLYAREGAEHSLSPKLVILCAGAVQSAVLLLRSADDSNPTGLANRSDQVGRNFMNHNSSAVIALSPWYRNDSVYQKTFGLNDFYLSDGAGGPPLGNVQLLGRISGAILKANMPAMPEWLLNRVSARGIDFYAMSEDLPSPESRVMVDGERVVLKWVRTNWQAHLDLVARLKAVLKKAGFPSCSHGPSTSGRPRTSAARSGSAMIPGRRRSTSIAAPSISESLHRRCRLPADLRRRQSGADRRGTGAACRRPYRETGSAVMTERHAPSRSSPAAAAASGSVSPGHSRRAASTSPSPALAMRRVSLP